MRTIIACLALLALFACQGQTQLTGAAVFAVQCVDGSFAELPSDCPEAPLQQQESPAKTEIQLAETAPTPAIEKIETPAPKPAPKLIVQVLLDKAPENYVYSDGAQTIYASGSKRSTGEWPFASPGLLYWDTTTPILNIWVGDISAHWWDTYKNQKSKTAKRMGIVGSSFYPAGIVPLTLTGNKKQDNELIPKEFLRYFQQLYYRAGGIKEDNLIKLILPYYVKSPLDILAHYADETPLSVDISDQTIVLPSGRLFSTLSLTFANKETAEPALVKDGETTYWSTPVNADRITFRFDSNERPVVIDKIGADGTLLERKTYTISETYTRQGIKNTPVDPRITELPPHIIVTVEDFDAWKDSVEDVS